MLPVPCAWCICRSVTLWVAARDLKGNTNPEVQQRVFILPDVTPPVFLSVCTPSVLVCRLILHMASMLILAQLVYTTRPCPPRATGWGVVLAAISTPDAALCYTATTNTTSQMSPCATLCRYHCPGHFSLPGTAARSIDDTTISLSAALDKPNCTVFYVLLVAGSAAPAIRDTFAGTGSQVMTCSLNAHDMYTQMHKCSSPSSPGLGSALLSHLTCVMVSILQRGAYLSQAAPSTQPGQMQPPSPMFSA